MAKVTVLDSFPTADPSAYKQSVLSCPSAGVDVRLKAAAGAGANVSVRPWYYEEGEWWPIGYDAVANTGAAPVTADATKMGGRAHGRYAFRRGPREVVLVLEAGALADIAEAFLDSVERE